MATSPDTTETPATDTPATPESSVVVLVEPVAPNTSNAPKKDIHPPGGMTVSSSSSSSSSAQSRQTQPQQGPGKAKVEEPPTLADAEVKTQAEQGRGSVIGTAYQFVVEKFSALSSALSPLQQAAAETPLDTTPPLPMYASAGAQQNKKVPLFPNEFRQDFWKELVYLKDQDYGTAPNHLKAQLTQQRSDKKIFMIRPSMLSPEQNPLNNQQPDPLRAIIYNPATFNYEVRALQSGDESFHFASLALITDCYKRSRSRETTKEVIQLRLAYNKKILRIITPSGSTDKENLSNAVGDLSRVLFIGKTWEATQEKNAIQLMIQDLFNHGFEAAVSTDVLEALKKADKTLKLDEAHITRYKAGPTSSSQMSSMGSRDYEAATTSSHHHPAVSRPTAPAPVPASASASASARPDAEAPKGEDMLALMDLDPDAALYDDDITREGPVTAKPDADDGKKKDKQKPN